MSLIRIPALAFLCALTFGSAACFWKKKPQAPPATPPPQTKSSATLKPAPPPPKLETAVPATAPPAVAVKIPEAPKPPQSKGANRRPRRGNPAAAKAQQPQPATQAPTPDPGPETPSVPKLGDLLTDAQRAEILKKCDQSLQQARTALDQLASKQLSPDAAESASRARVFILQAEQARGRDPQTALQLAQRAEVLARDLLRSNR